MAQAGHTKADYVVAEPGVDCVGIFGPEIEGGDREVVASVWFIDGDEDSAMKLARQFAAAPDLAEAASPVAAMVAALAGHEGFEDEKPVDCRHFGAPYNDFPSLTYGDLRRIAAALAKAESRP